MHPICNDCFDQASVASMNVYAYATEVKPPKQRTAMVCSYCPKVAGPEDIRFLRGEGPNAVITFRLFGHRTNPLKTDNKKDEVLQSLTHIIRRLSHVESRLASVYKGEAPPFAGGTAVLKQSAQLLRQELEARWVLIEALGKSDEEFKKAVDKHWRKFQHKTGE